jgi:protoheme IX farnesyltransferase
MARLYRFALATVLATLALIALGSLARLHPAGSGCGNDWPLCNGGWGPARSWESFVEYGHRIVALTVVAFAAATAALSIATPGATARVRLLATTSLGAILLQSLIGGFSARWSAPAGVAIPHLLVAMLFFGCAAATLATVATLRNSPSWLASLGRMPAPSADRPLAIAATLGAATALLLLLFGASTSASGAFACATWPLCGDTTAGLHAATIVHLGYRATALLGTIVASSVLVLAWRRGASASTRLLAISAVMLVVLQSGLNALAAATGNSFWISAPHLLIAALIWIAMLGASLSAWGPRPEPTTAKHRAPDAISPRGGAFDPLPTNPPFPGRTLAIAANPALGFGLTLPTVARIRRIVADYVALTKPGIISLLLVTTFCAMLIAQRGLPPFWLVSLTLLGGVLASGGANVLNCYLDRDIDGQMSRTRERAIVAGRVSPDAALAYGIFLSVAAVFLLGFFVNWTAAFLALAGNLFYVLVYTKWLKRSTPYNIVIGGAAGAVPPLVGWAAVTGDLSPLAWGLFAVVFAWTPPHFWALALLKQGEYTRAAVPMLPVVRGEAETRRQIVIYTVALALVCLALWPLGLGWLYLASAIALNLLFLAFAVRLYRDPSKRIARQMFFYSLWYLALLFVAAVLDRTLMT